MPTHFHPLKIKDIRRETPDCVSIAFDIPDELKTLYSFHAGQNITLKKIINGEELRRSYSICSNPWDNELRVAVKEIPEGRFSSFLNASLEPGDLLDVLPPSGRFYTPLDPANKKNYLAFAAGSGITPVISIISSTLNTEKDSQFTLVYGNRNRGTIIFKEQLEALKNKFLNRFALHHVLSREVLDSSIYNGRINATKCREMNGKLFDIRSFDNIFLCGPEEMIFSVKEWLNEEGIEKEKIHFELFASPGQVIASSGKDVNTILENYHGKHSEIVLKADGIQYKFKLEYDGISILDAALKQGADLPFACKGGVCSTCRAKILEGKVDMDTNYALEADELIQGYILTCQSHPRSENIVIDFDS